MSDKFIVKNSSILSNVTGAGTAYSINWDTTIIDPNAHISSGVAHLNSDSNWAIVGCSLTLTGVTSLISRCEIILTTSDGDFTLCDVNPFIGLSQVTLSPCGMFYLNKDNISPFTYTIKCLLSGGLTNSVSIAAGSQFWSLFV